MRYFIHLAYNGTTFKGWQLQQNTDETVQGYINRALSILLKEEINTMGCGRTDSGVHARDFYAHFDCENPIEDKISLVFKINKFLNQNIVVYDIKTVNENANARFDALSRTYQYFINQYKNPFENEFSYFLYGHLDEKAMNQACELLIGNNDFVAFSKTMENIDSTFCNLMQAEWQRNGHNLVFTIKANRFLRNMVRAIVGTLIPIGQNKIEPNSILNILHSKSRSNAGISVPGNALFLTKVEYPENIFKL